MKPLITRAATICATIGLATGLWTGTAHAHNYDNTSLWVCAATRPDSTWTIDHSWPYYVVPSHVGEVCIAHNGLGWDWCWHSDLNTDTGYMHRIGGPWDSSVCT